MNGINFEIHKGSPDSFVVLHVPHSARAIPSDVREQLLLTDGELDVELDEMTDSRTEILAAMAATTSKSHPWIFRNTLSRLVIDPERFPDEREPMNAVGMGAVYLKTSTGASLRDIDSGRDQRLIEQYFTPYATALDSLIGELLSAHGCVTIIDVHSYRMREHANSINRGQRRPPICIGVDPFHTPQWLCELAISAFSPIGEHVINEPYSGTYVPLSFYGVDPRVTSVMMENREDSIFDDKIVGAAHSLSSLIDGISLRKK